MRGRRDVDEVRWPENHRIRTVHAAGGRDRCRFRSGGRPPAHLDARFETIAWPDCLALIFAARPGRKPILEGEPCFGRIGGGYGFSGANHLEIPHALELEPEQPAPELWPFVVLERMRSPLIRAEGDRADFSLEGGLRHVPVTVAELSRPGRQSSRQGPRKPGRERPVRNSERPTMTPAAGLGRTPSACARTHRRMREPGDSFGSTCRTEAEPMATTPHQRLPCRLWLRARVAHSHELRGDCVP